MRHPRHERKYEARFKAKDDVKNDCELGRHSALMFDFRFAIFDFDLTRWSIANQKSQIKIANPIHDSRLTTL
jgi:hypothetical protein